MGVLARRFLNLIMPGRSPGVKLLRRIDLARHQLFYGDRSENPTTATGGQSMMALETIRFAGPSFTFRAVSNKWQMDCFPLADYSECKLVYADQSVFDLDSSMVSTIAALRKPWRMQPISVFVHKPHVDGNNNTNHRSNGSSLFLMEKFPQPEALRRGSNLQESDQFAGFSNLHSSRGASKSSWHYHLLPRPPFVQQQTCHWYNNNCGPITQITAYGVVGGGSHVCVSVEGVGKGTYCLDTESLTWSKVGHWTLPFQQD